MAPEKTARVKGANHFRLNLRSGTKRSVFGTRGYLNTHGPNMPFETSLRLGPGDMVRYRIVNNQVEILGKVEQKQRTTRNS